MYFILVTALGLVAAALGLWAITKIVEKNDRIEYLMGELTYNDKEIQRRWDVAQYWMDKSQSLQVELFEKEQEYEALERGMDEQEDNYEQQFLSLNEAIAQLKDRVEYLVIENRLLMDQVDYHEEHCLPDLATMRFMNQLTIMESS